MRSRYLSLKMSVKHQQNKVASHLLTRFEREKFVERMAKEQIPPAASKSECRFGEVVKQARQAGSESEALRRKGRMARTVGACQDL